MPSPVVTVLATAHNPGDYLRPAVASVLAQTLDDLEFLLIDDGSTDTSFASIADIDDPRLIVHTQNQQGLGTPVNHWLKAARGEFIMRMDADDLIHPERAARQVAYLREHPDVGLVGCQYRFFTASGDGPSSKLPTDHETITKGIARGWHTISHATTTYRTELVRQGLAYTWRGAGEDWSFLADAAALAQVAVLDDVLYHYRLHEDSSAWRGSRQTIEGLAYARARQASLLAGTEPLTQDEFVAARSSPLLAMLDRSRATSGVLYRRAIVDQIAGQTTKAKAFKALAAALDPVKTAGWATKTLDRRRSDRPSDR